jgi:uncharacterized protein YerC
MPHVSKIRLSKETEEELIRALNLVFARIGSGDEMFAFSNALLTDTEKLMLAKRLAIIVLLDQNLADAQISESLHVTRITVSKMRYFYEARGEGFRIALKKLEEQKQLKSFQKLLISLTKYSIRAAGGHVKPTILD